MRSRCLVSLLLFLPTALFGQQQTDPQRILERLEKLEEQNRELMAEVKALRQALNAQAPAPVSLAADNVVAEKVDVQEHRVEELAQTKVEAEHRFPIQLTGMLLFNTYWNGTHSGDQAEPVIASPVAGMGAWGAMLRQSTLGVRFQGPVVWGAKIGGGLLMDFYGGSGQSLDQLVRLRIASFDFEWKNTTLTFAQDKPLVAPREPESLAHVGVSPLTAAGNLWLWQPQIRVEQRFSFSESAGLRARLGVYQTSESTSNVPNEYLSSLARSRPSLEGHFEFWREFQGGRRIEAAPAFHFSNTQLAGQSLPSRVFAVDWLIRPHRHVDFTGTFFSGLNTAVLGGLRPGVAYFADGSFSSVYGAGGWGQVSIRATKRMTFNFFGGEQNNRASSLPSGAIYRNISYAGNLMYKLSANIVASFEASQNRTSYLGAGTFLVPHYDLALAYLF